MSKMDNRPLNKSVDAIVKSSENGIDWEAYKIPILIAVLIVLIGSFSYIVYSGKVKDANNLVADEISSFVNGDLKSLKEGKLEPLAAVASFNKLIEGKTSSVFSTLFLTMSDALKEKSAQAEARNILEKAEKLFLGSDTTYDNLLLARLAVVYEDLGEFNLSIESLKKILKLSSKVLEGKVYLDLGRMNLKLGNQDEARKNFEHVKNNFLENDFAKVATLYLEDMGSKK